MIWIIGGTTEGDKISEFLKDYPKITTLGTEEGIEFYSGKNYVYKRMAYPEMLEFIKENNIDTIVDVTHPFAKNVTANAKKAAANLNIKYFRYERPLVRINPEVKQFDSYEECLSALKDMEGTTLVTTGVNNIADYEKIRGEKRFVYRILPTVESVTKARELGVHSSDIVAMVGPFSKELNKAMISFYKADRIVMKDSGKIGGTQEKIDAAKEMGIEAMLIRRDSDSTESFEEFKKRIIENL